MRQTVVWWRECWCRCQEIYVLKPSMLIISAVNTPLGLIPHLFIDLFIQGLLYSTATESGTMLWKEEVWPRWSLRHCLYSDILGQRLSYTSLHLVPFFFSLLPPSEDRTLPSTIHTSATVLAWLPDVIAEKTREEGEGSLANGINQQPHGIIGFPSLTPLTLLITPLPSSSGLAEEPDMSRASVPMALKCWTLPYTCFPVSSSSIPYSLTLFLLSPSVPAHREGIESKFSLSIEGSQSTFSASPVSPQPTLLGLV